VLATELTPRLSRELGIRVVHQDLAVFPDLSVAENMRLGSGDFPRTRLGGVDWRRLRKLTQQQLTRFEISTRPDTLLRDLPVATRTQVAIARALWGLEPGSGLIIFDEPTAALPAHEAEMLHSVMRRLAADGHAILFVSHRLDEVLALTDRVTVFKDGRVMSEHMTEDLTERELIEAILGESVGDRQEIMEKRNDAEVLLTVESLAVGPLRDVTLNVRSGEVIGLAGLLGSGRTELLRAIYGELRPSAGRILLSGQAAHFSRAEQAIARGVVLVPEDRARGGAFADLSVDENMAVSVLPRYWRPYGFQRRRMRTDAAQLREKFKIRAAAGSTVMSALSGGNQQKAILARWLRRDPLLLLLDEPTQGVDVGARADIYAAIREITDAGGAALLVTSDLEELAQVADRAVVLGGGTVTAEVPRAELTAHRLNELIYSEGGNTHG
jgi:ribose transport system ATP-binding protein